LGIGNFSIEVYEIKIIDTDICLQFIGKKNLGLQIRNVLFNKDFILVEG